MMRVLILVAIMFGLSSCGLVRNTAGALGVGSSAVNRTTVEADGVRFRARTTVTSDDRRDFDATAEPFAANPEGAVEAARYQATRYCLLTFGGSDTAWTVGPDTPPEELSVEDDTVTLSGRCTQR